MSTVATHAGPAVSARFLLAAIATIFAVAAVVVALLAVTGELSGSSTGTGTRLSTSTHDNSCAGIRHGYC
jgi:hypothetical protein